MGAKVRKVPFSKENFTKIKKIVSKKTGTKMTNERIARITGYEENTISKCACDGFATPEIIDAIAQALDVDPWYLRAQSGIKKEPYWSIDESEDLETYMQSNKGWSFPNYYDAVESPTRDMIEDLSKKSFDEIQYKASEALQNWTIYELKKGVCIPGADDMMPPAPDDIIVDCSIEFPSPRRCEQISRFLFMYCFKLGYIEETEEGGYRWLQ